MREPYAGPSANSDLLWAPERLRAQLGTPELSIIDTRQAEVFAAGRIPGARHFDPYFVNCDDTDPQPLASFTRMWANLLGWRGVKPSDTIVFYGAFTDMCAARCFWFAEYLGHPRVHVLDGGMKAWSLAWNTADVPLADASVQVIQIRRTGKGCLSYLVGSGGDARSRKCHSR